MSTNAITTSATFQVLPTAKVDPSPTNPRKYFDQEKLDELTDSVKSQGVLEPLLVRSGKKGRFEIIAGERRWRAASAAGLKEVPAILREMTDDQVLDAQIHENLHRADVHPMDEAFGYQHLLKTVEGLTVEELARRVNKSPRYVAQRLSLATLIEPAVKDFMEGHITLGHAVQLSRLSPEVQLKALNACYEEEFVKWDPKTEERITKAIKENPVTVGALANWIEENIALDLKKAPWSLEDAALVPEQGPCSTCPSNTATNRLLFGDAAQNAVCTNPEGYKRKMRAWIDRQREAAMQESPDGRVLLLTALYGPNNPTNKRKYDIPDGAFGRDEFSIIEKKGARCESSRPAVFVQGERRGQRAWACADPQCKDHRGRKSTSSSSSTRGAGAEKSPAEKDKLRKRKQELFDARVSEPVRRRVLKALLDKINPETYADIPGAVVWPLGRDYFVRMAAEHFRRITSDTQGVMYELLGWTEALKVKGDAWSIGRRQQDKAVELVMALDDVSLARFLFLCSVAHYGENLGIIGGSRDQSEVIRLAQSHGVPYQLFDARERYVQSPGKKYHGAHGLHLLRVLLGTVPEKMPPERPGIYLDERLWNLSTILGKDGDLEAKVREHITATPWLDGPEGVVLPGARVRVISGERQGAMGELLKAGNMSGGVICQVKLDDGSEVEEGATSLVYVEGVNAELERRRPKQEQPAAAAKPSTKKGAKKAAGKKSAAKKGGAKAKTRAKASAAK
jgi:ParB family chromosome partitioning protein